MSMTADGKVYDERSPKWWDRWVNPTTVLTLIGGVVWGVQLNMMVVQLAADQAVSSAIVTDMREEVTEFRINQEKQTLILDNLVRQVNGIEIDVEQHNRESEEWKRRILQNELMRENGFSEPGNP